MLIRDARGAGRDRLTSMRRIAGAVMLSAAVAAGGVLAERAPQAAGQGGTSQKQIKSLTKLAEPWPDAATKTKQRIDAENRQLFRSEEVLPFTLKADFRSINRDRDRANTQVHPGELSFEQDGRSVVVAVEIRPRGVLRRQPRVCDQVPLRIDFPKGERAKLDKTPFEGQKELKLTVHCRDERDYEQFILREYLAYKAYNLITPRSFRARLARGTYVDLKTGKPVTARYAFFTESEEDLARRAEARTAVLPRTRFADHDADTLTALAVFEFMIGNTDYSLFVLHNVVILKTEANILFPIPYDFDITGLVTPPYGAPDRRLGIGALSDRLYRGPCRTAEQLEPTLAKFRASKTPLFSLIDAQPGLEPRMRDQVKSFLADFFELVNSPARVKRMLIDRCNKETV